MRAPSPLSLFHMDSLERCVLFGGQTHGRLISNQAGAGQAVMGLQKQTSIHVGDTSPSTIIVARNLAVPFTHNEQKRRRGTSDLASDRGGCRRPPKVVGDTKIGSNVGQCVRGIILPVISNQI